MSDQIMISIPEVQSYAKTIETDNQALTTLLMEAKAEMSKAQAAWQGDATQVLAGKIGQLQAKFDTYKQVIDSYSKFLVTTAEAYQATESSIQGDAGNLA